MTVERQSSYYNNRRNLFAMRTLTWFDTFIWLMLEKLDELDQT